MFKKALHQNNKTIWYLYSIKKKRNMLFMHGWWPVAVRAIILLLFCCICLTWSSNLEYVISWGLIVMALLQNQFMQICNTTLKTTEFYWLLLRRLVSSYIFKVSINFSISKECVERNWISNISLFHSNKK